MTARTLLAWALLAAPLSAGAQPERVPPRIGVIAGEAANKSVNNAEIAQLALRQRPPFRHR